MNVKNLNFKETAFSDIESHILCCKKLMKNNFDEIISAAELVEQTLKSGGTIFWCGNGGSASDSQHLNAELIGRFEEDRDPLRSVALTTDTSVITSLSNDYSYDFIFKRQLAALGKPGDLLIAISTSGNSKNIIEVLKEAKKMGIESFALLGKDGGKAKDIADKKIVVPSNRTSRIQEMHILIGHIICSLSEKKNLNKST